MAQGLLARAMPATEVRSAGLNALVGMPAHHCAVNLLQSSGIDISSHRATQIASDMCRSADLILTMSAAQRQRVEDLYPFARGRVYRICESAKQDVPDPYRQPEAAFRQALELIEAGTQDWLRRIHKI